MKRAVDTAHIRGWVGGGGTVTYYYVVSSNVPNMTDWPYSTYLKANITIDHPNPILPLSEAEAAGVLASYRHLYDLACGQAAGARRAARGRIEAMQR